MTPPDLVTFVVIGAVVGLLSVAVGHAYLVWLGRQQSARAQAPARKVPALFGRLLWPSAAVSGVLLLRSLLTLGSLAEQRASLGASRVGPLALAEAGQERARERAVAQPGHARADHRNTAGRGGCRGHVRRTRRRQPGPPHAGGTG